MFKNKAVKKCVFCAILDSWAIGSKMYAFVVSDGRSVRKVKGIPSAAVREYLTPEKIKEVLFSKQNAGPVPITQIRSLKHRNITLTSSKKSVRYVDDKRYCKDGIHTTPLGYYKNRTSAAQILSQQKSRSIQSYFRGIRQYSYVAKECTSRSSE